MSSVRLPIQSHRCRGQGGTSKGDIPDMPITFTVSPMPACTGTPSKDSCRANSFSNQMSGLHELFGDDPAAYGDPRGAGNERELYTRCAQKGVRRPTVTCSQSRRSRGEGVSITASGNENTVGGWVKRKQSVGPYRVLLWLSRVAPSAELKSVRLAGVTWDGRASGQEWPRPKAPHPGSGEAPFPLFSPSFFLSSYSFSCFGFFLMRLYRALEVVGVLARSCSGADLRQPEIPRRARGPI